MKQTRTAHGIGSATLPRAETVIQRALGGRDAEPVSGLDSDKLQRWIKFSSDEFREVGNGQHTTNCRVELQSPF